MKQGNNISVDASQLKCKDEYVCWIDIMGTKNIMSESFQKAANFILKFHSCVLDTVKDYDEVKYYPLMDGVFITSPNSKTIQTVIDYVFDKIADIFISESRNGHRFIIKGSLAYGSISHGDTIDNNVCDTISSIPEYKRSLLLGMPMIQAFNSERTAPPFGIYIHESARKYKVLQGKHYAWKCKTTDKASLLSKVDSYFSWCKEYSEYLEMDVKKIELYKKLAQEYFSDRMKKD